MVKKKLPNVVVIMFDEMRHDAVGFAGSRIVQTPTMDRLAGEGAMIENAYCASPICSPARASWLTGLYPHTTTQLYNYQPEYRGKWGHFLPKGVVTLGDVFKAEGYACGMAGPWHLGDDETPQHGFTDFWYPYRYQKEPERTDAYLKYLAGLGLLEAFEQDTSKKWRPHLEAGKSPTLISALPSEHQRTSWTVDRGIDFIKEALSPYFFFMSIKDPHPHLAAPRECLELYDPSDMPLSRIWNTGLEGKPAYLKNNQNQAAGRLGPEGIREITAHYFALITHIDRQLERFFSFLDSGAGAENTVVAAFSDHGELLFDFGQWGKGFFYEGAVRVPLFLRWPRKIPGGVRLSEPFAGVDLAPTLIELAGAKVPTPMHGRSWAHALLDGSEPEENTVLAEMSQDDADGNMPDNEHLAAMIMARRGRWKYIGHRFESMEELYDLEEDPAELRNLAGQADYSGEVKELKENIKDVLRHQGAGPYAWFLER